MTYEVQTWDATDNTVYYEIVKNAIDYESARDMMVKKYPNRKVIAVIEKKTLDELTQEHFTGAPDLSVKIFYQNL
jgi:hypothetical protein